MKIAKTERFTKLYQKLPQNIRRKVDKQITILAQDFFYPSLNTKRVAGGDVWEARVDRHFRFTFSKTENIITLLTVGPHDEGLGKR